MLDQRLDKRRHLIYNLRLEDADSGDLLGHLADISSEGLLMIAKQAFKPEQEFTLRLRYPPESNDHLEFKARCMWSRQDVNPDYFISGFKVQDPDQTHIDAVNELIRGFGFSD